MNPAIFEIIRDNPGINGFQIHRRLLEQSRAARWFGKDSVLAYLFGPSIGGMYISIYEMEAKGLIWAKKAKDSGHRHYRVMMALHRDPAGCGS